ncbi:MAG: FHA domain-containing protein [Pirellulales bacterium]|nr:FHA domain-containing protein [Pirellulales bacterium]
MTSSNHMPDRMLLWVDAVGGYLVCLGSEIAIGQPSSDVNPDVPILADLSRRHAIVRREGEGYTIEAVRSTKVDGRAIHGTAPLYDGSAIELGEGVRLRFLKPHPLSSTAKLEFVSRHRTQPSTDAVLLMADSCVIGPAKISHIVAHRWQDEMVLFRNGHVLGCRTSAKFSVDGASKQGRCILRPKSRVEGAEFAFAIEPFGS